MVSHTPRYFQSLCCGNKTRTCDLWVMSPTSCQLLHPACSRFALNRGAKVRLLFEKTKNGVVFLWKCFGDWVSGWCLCALFIHWCRLCMYMMSTQVGSQHYLRLSFISQPRKKQSKIILSVYKLTDCIFPLNYYALHWTDLQTPTLEWTKNIDCYKTVFLDLHSWELIHPVAFDI